MSAARCDSPKLYASHGPCTNGPEMFQRAPTSNSNRRPQKVGRRKFPSLSSHPSTTNNNHRNNSLACNCVYLHCIRYGCCVVRSTVAGWASALTRDLEHCQQSRFLDKVHTDHACSFPPSTNMMKRHWAPRVPNGLDHERHASLRQA
ncbi:hypothetical protein VDGE_30459 [Verticillium dahliae]|uniref:Uncharacterized protein n=1 Tax=Verticillium dahliae TaxID=27337 RepID=A0A444RXQ0_VERDA|nr:hypothetical protein VDGE_30459 [Verticillium dahliae]